MFGLVLSFWSQFIFCLSWIVQYLFALLSYPTSVREHNRLLELFHCSRETAPGSAVRPCLTEWGGEQGRKTPARTSTHSCTQMPPPHVTAHTHSQAPCTHACERKRQEGAFALPQHADLNVLWPRQLQIWSSMTARGMKSLRSMRWWRSTSAESS